MKKIKVDKVVFRRSNKTQPYDIEVYQNGICEGIYIIPCNKSFLTENISVLLKEFPNINISIVG